MVLSATHMCVQGVQLYTTIYDADMGADDLVDIVVTNHNQTVGLQSQGRLTVGTFVLLNLTITALCAQNFGGPDCSQCVQGFTGPNCDEVDDCVDMDCNGNGLCVDDSNSFSCTCNPGFTGEFCQTNIDNCVGVNCSRNGWCVDGNTDSFSCTCNSGFMGPNCDEVDDCFGVICSGNGQCVDEINNFTCECMTGYGGPLCSEGTILIYCSYL